MWERTGIKPKELEDLVELPDLCLHAWKAFIELHEQRSGSGFAPNPISYSEIYAYTNLCQVYLEPWEVDLIKKFDREALSFYAKQAEKAQAKKKK